MIKIDNIVPPSSEQIQFTIEGMRNPKNSWIKIDTENGEIGQNDLDLMSKLVDAGVEHRKFLRMLPVGMRITAPLYWWKEHDTYKIGTASNSCSTMHKLLAKPFELDDFSFEKLSIIDNGQKIAKSTIHLLNQLRNHWLNIENEDEKKLTWYSILQLLPESYNQTRNITYNYEVLRNIYSQRKNHKLYEWLAFCSALEALPYFKQLIKS